MAGMFWRATLGLSTALVLLLSGCYSDVDSFIVAKAKQDCKRLASCNASFFSDAYDDDLDKCREDGEDLLQAIYDIGDAFGGEYDPEQGRTCVSATRKARNDCSAGGDDDVRDACDRVVN